MSRTLLGRITLVLLLATLCGAPLAAKQPARLSLQASEKPWVSWLTGFLLKAGCSLDPSGSNCPRLSSPEGCSLDPSGCTHVTPKLDNGCSLDPDGRCIK